MERGEIVTLGQHRLMCGDATNPDDVAALMDGKKADMLFTDPPYGVGYEGGHFHSGDVSIRRKRARLVGDGDAGMYERFLPIVLPHLDGPGYLWFASTLGEPVYRALRENRCSVHALIVWHKTNATYAAMGAQYKQRHECCLYFKPKRSTLRWCGPTNERTIWEMKRDPRNVYHPTQKPVSLARRALSNHKATNVLDCFAGAGSSLLAAEKLGRSCFAMEIEPAYCHVIIERWKELVEQTALVEEAA